MSTKYGTPRQVEDVKARLRSYESVKNDPYRYGTIEDKPEFNKGLEKTRRELESITPPELTGADRDRLVARQKVLTDFIREECPQINKPAMVSRSATWDKPTGSVDQHLRWDRAIQQYTLDPNGNPVKAKDGYSAFDEFKDNNRALNFGDEGIDTSNIERIRKENETARSFVDRESMQFSGPRVTEEQFDERVGVPEERRCKGLRSNGEQCGARAQLNSQFCRHHQTASAQ